MDDAKVWALIHRERAGLAETLASLTPAQWAERSLCGSWSVKVAAAHVVVGAEQSTGRFMKGMVGNAFRFNAMVDGQARRAGAATPSELIDRLQARTTTTNRPPAPVATMLGEIVVHGEDIRRPLGLEGDVAPDAVRACLELFSHANFPVGGKKRMDGLRFVATDVEWSEGSGPEVTGPGMALLMAITGRRTGTDGLTGPGVATLERRMSSRVAA
jgi:uncharacterized protein (TIGR03083 family)